ncbi:MAG: RDD family protein [Acidobacteria bacterium]|nr:RDD family protein [Acidobacteriota bacterium]
MKPPQFQSDTDRALNCLPSALDQGAQNFSTTRRPKFVLDADEEGARSAERLEPRACSENREHPGVYGGEKERTSRPAADDLAFQEVAPEEARKDQSARTFAAGSPLPDAPLDWRDQVSAKVSRHRLQKPHKPRYPSLELFSRTPVCRTPKPDADPGGASLRESLPDESREVNGHKSRGETAVVLGATARVIEFPRLVPMPMRRDELAEPLLDRPRIVEAPELLPPPPAMGGILIETSCEPEPSRRSGLDMPLLSASLNRRLWAGVVDVLFVGIAMAVFGYVFFRMTAVIPPVKTMLQIAAGVLALLWPAYQYALLVLSGTTPGMKLTRMQVLGFDGCPPSRQLRRWRVLASLLSSASLGLGYAWCFLDEEQLSWHGRITRTHVARRCSQK